MTRSAARPPIPLDCQGVKLRQTKAGRDRHRSAKPRKEPKESFVVRTMRRASARHRRVPLAAWRSPGRFALRFAYRARRRRNTQRPRRHSWRLNFKADGPGAAEPNLAKSTVIAPVIGIDARSIFGRIECGFDDPRYCPRPPFYRQTWLAGWRYDVGTINFVGYSDHGDFPLRPAFQPSLSPFVFKIGRSHWQ